MFIPDLLSEELVALKDSVASLLTRYAGEESLRRTIEAQTHDPDLWARMARMGLHGLAIPERFGGAGGGPLELFVACREMGRVLLSCPFFSSVGLAANLLLSACDEEAQERYLPSIALGEAIASAAICEDDGGWYPTKVSTTFGDDGRLNGLKRSVIDAASADVLLVVAHHREHTGVFAVDPHAEGVQILPLSTLDLTRPMADVALDGVAAVPLSGPTDRSGDIWEAIRAASVALAAEQVGGAEAVMMASLEYAKIRVQFGRTIGSFQAIKHKLADMALDLERMTSAGWSAARSASSSAPLRWQAAHLAQAFCSESYFRLAAENIQIHGGIGFTWEHSAHLYFRRAKADEDLCGTPRYHRNRLLKSLLAAPTSASTQTR